MAREDMAHPTIAHKGSGYSKTYCGQVMVFQFTLLVDDLGIDLEYDTFKYLSTELTLRDF